MRDGDRPCRNVLAQSIQQFAGKVRNFSAFATYRTRTGSRPCHPSNGVGLLQSQCGSLTADDWKACRDHVRKQLGLPEPKLETQKKSGGKWLAEYIYRDENSECYLKVRKIRDEAGYKQFPQFHWDGNGWAKGKPSGPKIPYRLPELNAAPKTAPVFFVEGEKDAGTLAKISFVATTASEGASAKWDAALTHHFATGMS